MEIGCLRLASVERRRHGALLVVKSREHELCDLPDQPDDVIAAIALFAGKARQLTRSRKQETDRTVSVQSPSLQRYGDDARHELGVGQINPRKCAPGEASEHLGLRCVSAIRAGWGHPYRN